VALIEAGRAEPVRTLSRRRRFAAMAVDVAGDVAVTMFARQALTAFSRRSTFWPCETERGRGSVVAAPAATMGCSPTGLRSFFRGFLCWAGMSRSPPTLADRQQRSWRRSRRPRRRRAALRWAVDQLFRHPGQLRGGLRRDAESVPERVLAWLRLGYLVRTVSSVDVSPEKITAGDVS